LKTTRGFKELSRKNGTGAPGLAFETWDPPSRARWSNENLCRQNK
jgi:hypothetical protein